MNYRYSYSGSDCDAWAFFPGGTVLYESLKKNNLIEQSDTVKAEFFKPVKLSSMATVSISIHEAKSPVRRLGERGVAGYTRGIRTIAGTIVFLVIEDHPLRILAAKDPANIYNDLIGWSRDNGIKGTGSTQDGYVMFDNKVSTLISPLNIILKYQTEVGVKEGSEWKGAPGASMMLEGLEFVNEGIVTSVNDMVTEVVCQFVAQDIRPFTSNDSTLVDEIISAYIKVNANDAYWKQVKSYYKNVIQSTKEYNVSAATGRPDFALWQTGDGQTTRYDNKAIQNL